MIALQFDWDKESIQQLIDTKIINVAVHALSGLTFDVVDISDDIWHCQVAKGTLLYCINEQPIRARSASKEYSIYPGQIVQFQEFVGDGAEMLVTFYDDGSKIAAIVESCHFLAAPCQ